MPTETIGPMETMVREIPFRCEHGDYHDIYGLFPGGDPRKFVPDAEESTPEEIQRHKEACEAWERGEGVDRGPSCMTMGDGSAVTGTGYGIGTYPFDCDDPLPQMTVAKARQYDTAFAALESALRATLRFHHDRNHTETMTYQDCKMPPCEHATAALALAEGVRS